MEFRILGPMEVRTAEGEIRTFTRRKQRQLLAILLLNANRPVATDTIIDWLWNGRPPASALQNLHSYTSDLRRRMSDEALPYPRIKLEAKRYVLRTEPGELDADRFEDLAAQGHRLATENQFAAAVERFTRALGLWRAETIMEDLPLPTALRPETERLSQLRSATIEALFDARLALGQHRELIPDLQAATNREPYREQLWKQRVLALYRAGRQADALAVYEQVREILVTGVGIDPGPDLRRLHQQILNADPALTLTERVEPRGPSQLPADLPTFTGRAKELQELITLAEKENIGQHAVVISAIDGMAGIGKTALAVHAGHRLAAKYPDGQVFLDLQGFTEGVARVDPADALGKLLRSLGVPAEQIPASIDERAALWRTRLAGRRLLILLDNAASEVQIAPLAPGAGGCLALVTSRRRLAGLDAAHSISLDVLPLSDATRLFRSVAGKARVDGESPELITQIVELCGRLPLAIRMAAARFRHRPAWTLTHLHDRLRDEEQRLQALEAGQRSVSATLHLSYLHLDQERQRAFRLLGLHPGNDIEPCAASALLKTSPSHAERLLDELLDEHLLQQRRHGRYFFHDLVRAYAAQTCDEHEPEPERHAALTRHFDRYCLRATGAMDAVYPHEADYRPRPTDLGHAVVDEQPVDPAAWLDDELSNLLAVATRAAERGMDAYTVYLSTTLHRHLHIRGHYAEAMSVHGRALDAARRSGDRRGEHRVLAGLAHAYRARGMLGLAADCFEQSVQVARVIGYRRGELEIAALGILHFLQGRHADAVECLNRGVAVAREIGDRNGEVGPTLGLGAVHRSEGRYESADTCYRRALDLARDVGDRRGQQAALTGLGRIHQAMRHYRRATDCFERALGQAVDLGDRDGELSVLNAMSSLLRTQGQSQKAATTYQEVLRIAQEIGDRNYQIEAMLGMGETSLSLGQFDRSLECFSEGFKIAVALEQPGDQARANHGMAQVSLMLGRPDDARRHWQEALRILEEAGLHRCEEVGVEEIRTCLGDLEDSDGMPGKAVGELARPVRP